MTDPELRAEIMFQHVLDYVHEFAAPGGDIVKAFGSAWVAVQIYEKAIKEYYAPQIPADKKQVN